MRKFFFTHKTSIVEDSAIIGAKTKIWHWSHISAKAQIGSNCTIGQNVFVGKNVKIFSNVKIQNNVSVFEGVTLKKNVFCGPGVVFTNVKYPRSKYKTPSKKYDKTVINENVTIGANSTIVCGLKIGKYSFIGAGSVVTKNVKANSVVVGNPAKIIAWICNCGKKISKTKIKNNKCSKC